MVGRPGSSYRRGGGRQKGGRGAHDDGEMGYEMDEDGRGGQWGGGHWATGALGWAVNQRANGRAGQGKAGQGKSYYSTRARGPYG